MKQISQKKLRLLVQLHEPKASKSKQQFRMATCVACGNPMIEMWHCWLEQAGFKKEVHLCDHCYQVHAEEIY
jgi:hypothetical protein